MNSNHQDKRDILAKTLRKKKHKSLQKRNANVVKENAWLNYAKKVTEIER